LQEGRGKEGKKQRKLEGGEGKSRMLSAFLVRGKGKESSFIVNSGGVNRKERGRIFPHYNPKRAGEEGPKNKLRGERKSNFGEGIRRIIHLSLQLAGEG